MDNKLVEAAWLARDKAHPWKSGTKVGCAIEGASGGIFRGWNIEGLWMTSIHAEVCAITQLVGTGQKGIKIAIASECSMFTPCGACLDWLMQFCEPTATIIIANRGTERRLQLGSLYPCYPKQ